MNLAIEFDDLIGRVRLGDPEAIGELLCRFEADVRLAASSGLGKLARAQGDSLDIVQSVFVRFLDGLRENRFDISTPERIGRLLRFAARDRAAERSRKARRRGSLLAAAIASGHRRLHQTWTDDPARVGERDDLIAYVMGFMSPLESEAVRLRIEGHSTTQAAAILGIDADLLQVRLRRMRARLPEGCERLAEVF